jgi:tetratricopeptide (TPR) repeat protein
MNTLRLKATCFGTEDNSRLNVPANPKLLKIGNVMKTILTALLVPICAGLLPGDASAQKEKWGGENQKCAVVDCNSSSPPASSGNSGGSADRDINTLNDADQTRYDELHNGIVQVLKGIPNDPSAKWRMESLKYAMKLLREKQALKDGPQVQKTIAQVEALILWTSGVIDDEKGNYWKALGELHEAYKRRPELFNEGNFNYMSDVTMRHVASLPKIVVEDPSVVVPDKVLKHAISDVFYHSPPGVSDRVRKAFQAVMLKDWKVAKAWFQDALNLEPDNVNLKIFISIVDDPETPDKKTEYLKQGPDSGTNLFGEKLPKRFTLESLKANSGSMNNQQIMKALEDIIFLQFVESNK